MRSAAAVLAITCCLSTLFALGSLRGNEYDVLPSAKQFVDPAWLPHDWYLNQAVGYRLAFNCVAGLALKAWSFTTVAVAGRLLIFLGFACACVRLCRAFSVSLWFCLPWIYAYLPTQSLAAGEWVIKSLETKPIAYVAALFALAELARRRYRPMAAWLGVALSFHLLIGVYAGMCSCSCLLLREHREAWRQPWRWMWPGLLTGSTGLSALLEYEATHASLDPQLARRASEIYVTLRVPHHVLPSAWLGQQWPYWLALLVAANLVLWRRGPRYRLLCQYALSAAGIFLVGLLIAHLGLTSTLRFYWFRFGDTMLPLLGWFLLAICLSDLRRTLEAHAQPTFRALGTALGGLMVVLTLALATITFSLYVRREPWMVFGEDARRTLALPHAHSGTMGQWIQAHTDRAATFMIDPTLDSFYVDGERAVFVSFKHSPQEERDILAWYTRLLRLTGGRPLLQGGISVLGELQAAYRELTADEVVRTARDYGLDYMLSPNGQLPFPVAYRDAGLTLYRMPPKGDR